MKSCSLLMFAWVAHPVMAQATLLMDARQQKNLGIVVAPAHASAAVVSRRLPGEVLIPVGQDRLVATAHAGMVEDIRVSPGEYVKKGQVLATLASPDFAATQRDYLQARSQARLAKNTFERDEELFRDGIIAERRFLSSKGAHEEASLALAQRRRALEDAGMDKAGIESLEAKGQLASGLTLRAPISGQVLEKLVKAGQRIEASTPLFRIGSLASLWVEIHAPLEVARQIKTGTPVRIPKVLAEGRVLSRIPTVNQEDQTVHIRVVIHKNADKLSPGQFVETEVQTSGAQGAEVSVPRSAVVRSGQDSYVFVQVDKGFAPRKVTVRSEQQDHVVLAGGLGGTEKIAVTGTVALKAAWTGGR